MPRLDGRARIVTGIVTGLLAAASAACATPAAGATPAAPPARAAPTVVGPGHDAVARALPAALRRLRAHGFDVDALARHTRVEVHPTLEGFIAVTGQDVPELRAWTTYDVVHLAPLQAWRHHDDAHVVTRLTHELCHAALYQAFGSAARARDARIPVAFAEGACSVVAGQGGERAPLEVVLRHAPANALDRAFFSIDPAIAYAAAHHAMAWVQARAPSSPSLFADIIRRAAKAGGPGCVARAFAAATGIDLAGLWPVFVDSLGRRT